MSDTKVFVPWAVFDAETQELKCERCGSKESAPLMPIDLFQFVDVMNGFALRHASCVEVL